jgi:hypothetical protein
VRRVRVLVAIMLYRFDGGCRIRWDRDGRWLVRSVLRGSRAQPDSCRVRGTSLPRLPHLVWQMHHGSSAGGRPRVGPPPNTPLCDRVQHFGVISVARSERAAHPLVKRFTIENKTAVATRVTVLLVPADDDGSDCGDADDNAPSFEARGFFTAAGVAVPLAPSDTVRGVLVRHSASLGPGDLLYFAVALTPRARATVGMYRASVLFQLPSGHGSGAAGGVTVVQRFVTCTVQVPAVLSVEAPPFFPQSFRMAFDTPRRVLTGTSEDAFLSRRRADIARATAAASLTAMPAGAPAAAPPASVATTSAGEAEVLRHAVRPGEMCADNYGRHFHSLLLAEEAMRHADMARCDAVSCCVPSCAAV